MSGSEDSQSLIERGVSTGGALGEGVGVKSLGQNSGASFPPLSLLQHPQFLTERFLPSFLVDLIQIVLLVVTPFLVFARQTAILSTPFLSEPQMSGLFAAHCCNVLA